MKKLDACLVAWYWLQDLEVDPNKTVKNGQKKTFLFHRWKCQWTQQRVRAQWHNHTPCSHLSMAAFWPQMFPFADCQARVSTSGCFLRPVFLWKETEGLSQAGETYFSYFWEHLLEETSTCTSQESAPLIFFFFFNQIRFKIGFFFDFQKYLRSKTTGIIYSVLKYCYMYSLKWVCRH